MSSNVDFHKKPFPEETKTKLKLFRDYTEKWLPVFIKGKSLYWNKINIFDFFAGPGTDSEGTKGSPLLLINEVKKYLTDIKARSIDVSLYFNEYNDEKYSQLYLTMESLKSECHPCSVYVSNADFSDIFKKYYPLMSDSNTANLIFLDQCGVKYITPEVFHSLTCCKATDFLFFYFFFYDYQIF